MSKITDINAALDPQFERVDTPRKIGRQGNTMTLNWANFARQLERKLAEAQEELNDKRKFCYDVEQALEGMKGDYVEIISALRKDAAMKEGGK